MYKEKFKVGDWITITDGIAKKSWLEDTHNRTFQIDKEKSTYYLGTYWGINNGKALCANFRKATSEEILNAQKTIVKMHSSNKGEFEIEVQYGKAYYRPENKELPKKWIKDIINSFEEIVLINKKNPYNIHTTTIVDVGCYHGCKKEDWENVYKLLK